MRRTYCDFCRAELEGSREFLYQMESLDFVDDEKLLEAIHNAPDYMGEPLRLCKACHESVEENRLSREAELAEQQRGVRRFYLIVTLGTLFLLGVKVIAVIRSR